MRRTLLASRTTAGGGSNVRRRGYLRVGAELTSGKPDQKEGLDFGEERPADDLRVLAGTP